MNFNPFIFLFLAIIATNGAKSQEIQCREEIKPAGDISLSYKQRGDRCEGLFSQNVSATGIRIAAYHKNGAIYNKTDLAINISSNNSNERKHIIVTSLKANQFYRMDASFSGMHYSLPLDIVNHPDVNVIPSDFAAVICKNNCETSSPTLAPASFGEEASYNPYIALIANLELFELRISIKATDTGEVLFDKEMLGQRTWPAARPATFPLKPYLEGRDSIVLEVIAVGRGNKLIDSVSVRLEHE